jgi:hypothetical protein
MAKRVSNVTPEESRIILEAWMEAVPRMPDVQRTVESFERVLYSENVVWYHGPTPQSFIYLTGVMPGLGASFHALNLDGRRVLADLTGLRQTVKEIMAENDLPRLVVYVPAPLTAVTRAAKDIGFKQEGRLRRATIFNGKATDLVVLGILFEELELGADLKKKRRRRRGRRKAKKS